MNALKVALLIGISFLIYSFDFAGKKDIYPGYVIFNNDHREEGKIQPGSLTDNEVKIKFIEKGKKKVLKPEDIKEYGFEKIEKNDLGNMVKKWYRYVKAEADYPPKPFGSNEVFMELEVEGALNLYSYYIEMRAKREDPFQHSYYIKGETGKLTLIEEKTFRRQSRKFFKDYSAMSSQIGKKQFRYDNLKRMVRDYNFWVKNQHDSNEYKVSPENYDKAK